MVSTITKISTLIALAWGSTVELGNCIYAMITYKESVGISDDIADEAAKGTSIADRLPWPKPQQEADIMVGMRVALVAIWTVIKAWDGAKTMANKSVAAVALNLLGASCGNQSKLQRNGQGRDGKGVLVLVTLDAKGLDSEEDKKNGDDGNVDDTSEADVDGSDGGSSEKQSLKPPPKPPSNTAPHANTATIDKGDFATTLAELENSSKIQPDFQPTRPTMRQNSHPHKRAESRRAALFLPPSPQQLEHLLHHEKEQGMEDEVQEFLFESFLSRTITAGDVEAWTQRILHTAERFAEEGKKIWIVVKF
ncbi:hypothetical protein DFH27DRAFT_656698 [Peziza echinospora]|nr:hypothetical protein DFH27DRAFT_656698 [Peziza echinospora]